MDDDLKKKKAIKRATDWNKINKEKHNKHTAKWRKNNPEKQTSSNKRWREHNQDKLLVYRDDAKTKQKELILLPITDPRGRNFRESRMFHDAKKRARKYGLDFNLDRNDISIPNNCPVFGFPLIVTPGGSNSASPSLDRIDNDKGYIKGNIIVVSLLANQIKSNATAAQLRIVADFYEAQTKKTSSSNI